MFRASAYVLVPSFLSFETVNDKQFKNAKPYRGF
jgi:hypothetical protein